MRPTSEPATMASIGTISHSAQRRIRLRRERSGGGAWRVARDGTGARDGGVKVGGRAAMAGRLYRSSAERPKRRRQGGWHAGRGARGWSAGVPAAQEIALGEVVPEALGADLDDVAGALLDGAMQVRQPVAGPDPAGELPQGVPEHVGHVDERVLGAHRAGRHGRLADVAGGAQQLRVGVADLLPGQAPAAKVSQRRPLHERVVDQPHASHVSGRDRIRGRSLTARPVYPRVQRNRMVGITVTARHGGRASLTPGRDRIYRGDTSDRYIWPEDGHVGGRARARASCTWAPQGGTDVGRRAEEAAQRQARRLLASQLRITVPMPQAAARGRRARGRGEPLHLSQEARLSLDRTRRAGLPRAARIGRRPRPRAGPLLHAAGLLPVPAPGDAARPARTTPRLPAGASEPPARLVARGPRPARRVHARADGPRAGRART